jgi:hypothetical protein
MNCFRARFILAGLTAIASLSLACEVDTRVSINGRNPPTFRFQGTGYLTFFTVKEIVPENQNIPDVEQDQAKNQIIWWIWPSKSLDMPMSETALITYGRVPTGFYQKIPQDGAPPTLIEGKVYEAGGPAASAHGGYVRFVVRDGKTVEIPTPTRR